MNSIGPPAAHHPDARRIELCRFVNGNTKISREGFALLSGRTLEELDAGWDWQSPLPAAWERQMRKRAKAAIDAMGTNATSVALSYWAILTWGSGIEHLDGVTVAVLPPGVVP